MAQRTAKLINAISRSRDDAITHDSDNAISCSSINALIIFFVKRGVNVGDL